VLLRCSTSTNASRFLFVPTAGREAEYSVVAVIGIIERTETSGQEVVIDFGVSGASEFGQAGSGKGVGERDGEPHGAIRGGERATVTDREEDFLVFGGTCGGGDADLRGDGGEGLLAGRARIDLEGLMELTSRSRRRAT